jgi:hemolysin activation/secretion protein
MGAVVSAQYDTRQFPSHPQTAWFVTAIVENGLDVGPGDFGFTTFTMDACRYNEIVRGLNLDLRAKAFTTWDDLPRQRQQSLNGYGGIRGLHDIPFDVRRGDRLALFSAEVRVDMPPAPLLKVLFTRWNLMAFADIGLLRQYGDAQGAMGFLRTDWRAWGKSVGVGISGESFVPYIGLYVAQDLDRDNRRPRFIVRFERSF